MDALLRTINRLNRLNRLAQNAKNAPFAQTNDQQSTKHDWSPWRSSYVDWLEGPMGVSLSVAQRTICLVTYDGLDPADLDEEHVAAARRIFGPVDRFPPLCRAVLAAVCGARGGKTYIFAALYALWRLLTAELGHLAAGEIGVIPAVAPDKATARVIKHYVEGAAKAHPQIEPLISSAPEDSVQLVRSDGRTVALDVMAASRGGRATRGRSFLAAILDESAFFLDSSYRVNDVDIFDSVHARVMPGGCTVIVSTPFAESGLLYNLFQKNFGHPANAVAAHAPTLELRAGHEQYEQLVEMIASVRAVDEQKARREYDAEFLSLGSQLFFDPAAVRRCLSDTTLISSSVGIRPVSASIGGDLGLVHDASAFVVVHKHGDEMHVADVLELQPLHEPLRLSSVVAQGAELAASHKLSRIWADQYALEPAREHAAKHALVLDAMPAGQAGKVESYTRLKHLIHAGLLKIHPRHERLVRQLSEVIATPTSGGGLRISSPRKDSERGGEHGDLVSALVAAVHGLGELADVAPAEETNARLAANRALQSRWGANAMRPGMLGGLGGRGF